jgi:hypothetical protein
MSYPSKRISKNILNFNDLYNIIGPLNCKDKIWLAKLKDNNEKLMGSQMNMSSGPIERTTIVKKINMSTYDYQ